MKIEEYKKCDSAIKIEQNIVYSVMKVTY